MTTNLKYLAMPRVSLVLFALLSVFISGCVSSSAQKSNDQALVTIANPSVTKSQLVDALRALRNSKQTNEAPSFWTQIANNPKFSWDHRRRAVLQLFSRHFHPGMTFAEVTRLLDHPTWLERRCIDIGAVFTGQLPPGFTGQEGMVCILIGAGSPVSFELYFRIDNGYVGVNDHLYECLMGAPPNQKLVTLKIDEVASGEYVDREELFNTWGIPPEQKDPKKGSSPY